MAPFPRLAENWEPTRTTLHAYAKAIGTLPQTHVAKHGAWWHISLKPRPGGLTTDNMNLPGGGLLDARLDFRSHEVVLTSSSGWEERFDMREGRSGSEMADAVIEAAASQGLSGDYVRKDFEDDAAGEYDEDAVPAFWTALTSAAMVFESHRANLDHRAVGPVQFWPHGFDLAFEWFGTRQVEYEDTSYPSQLNLGFYSTGRAYFYSNPFPFEGETLRKHELALGEWCEDMFQGSILYYDQVADDPEGAKRVSMFAHDVFTAASPTLTA